MAKVPLHSVWIVSYWNRDHFGEIKPRNDNPRYAHPMQTGMQLTARFSAIRVSTPQQCTSSLGNARIGELFFTVPTNSPPYAHIPAYSCLEGMQTRHLEILIMIPFSSSKPKSGT